MKLKASDFSSTYNIGRTTVYKLRNYGKLIIDEAGFIDTEAPTNRIWIEKKLSNFRENDRTSQLNIFSKNNENKTDSGITYLKKLNLKEDFVWKKMRNQEKNGKLVDIDWVKHITSSYLRDLIIGFQNLADNTIRDIASRYGINRDIQLETERKFHEYLNKTCDIVKEKAIDNLQEMARNFVKENENND